MRLGTARLRTRDSNQSFSPPHSYPELDTRAPIRTPGRTDGASRRTHALHVHLTRHDHPEAGEPCVQVALNKMHREGYCGAHCLPVGKTAAERVGTRTSCRSGSEAIRRSTTSAIHGTNSLLEVPNIVEAPIAVASKKMVKSASRRHCRRTSLVAHQAVIRESFLSDLCWPNWIFPFRLRAL